MEGFCKSLERSRVLKKLRLYRLEFVQTSILSSSFASMVKACPLKWLELEIGFSKIFEILITAETLRDLFFALSHRRMEHIHIRLYPDISFYTRQRDMAKMQEGFTEFLKTQTNLSYLYFILWFGNSEKKVNISPFSCIP